VYNILLITVLVLVGCSATSNDQAVAKDKFKYAPVITISPLNTGGTYMDTVSIVVTINNRLTAIRGNKVWIARDVKMKEINEGIACLRYTYHKTDKYYTPYAIDKCEGY
jgi:hypothetical protein